MLEIKNLSKKYKKTIAVNDFSFSFKKGKIYGMFGPVGSGKSTIIDIITGYIAPDCGSVIINDLNFQSNSKEVKSLIGCLFEKISLYDSMTVREYLDFAAEIKGIGKNERMSEVDRVMDEVNISDIELKLIKNISQNNKKLVELAQAIIGKPDILILDEPMAGIASKEIEIVKSIIRKYGKEHLVIVSSHSLSEVNSVCDEILVFSKGKLIASESKENMKKLLGETDVIIVSIAGKAEKAVSVLKKIPEIKKVENIGKNSSGHNQLKINYVCENSIKDIILSSLKQSKITIVEVIEDEGLQEEFIKKIISGDASEE